MRGDSSVEQENQQDWPAQAKALMRRLEPQVVLENPVAAEGPIAVVGASGCGKTELIEALSAEAGTLIVTEISEENLTSQSLVGAQSAVIVLDAGAPMDTTDISIVRTVAGRIHHIVFALTKIDAYEDWRIARERAAQELENLGPRFASAVIYPLSARLHHLAMNSHDPLHVRQWSAASGVRELAAQLGRIENFDVVRKTRQNWLRYLDGQLSAAGVKAQDPQREEELSKQHQRVVRERSQQLRAHEQIRAERRDMLRSQLQLARVDLAVELNSKARLTSSYVRESVTGASWRQLKNVAEVVIPAVIELDQHIVRLCHDRITAIGSTVLGRTDLHAVSLFSQPELRPTEHLEPPRHGAIGLEDFMVVLVGVSAGVGLGRILMYLFDSVPMMTRWSVPLAVVLGLLIAVFVVLVRRVSVERLRANAWATEAVAYRRGQLDQAITTGLVHAETELNQILEDHFAHQRAQRERRMELLEDQAKDIASQLRLMRSRKERIRSEIFTIRKGLVAQAKSADNELDRGK